MTARNFYYGADATMVSGSASFAAGIGADYESLGLSIEQCAEYQAVDAALQDAYHAAITPVTRTPVAIAGKNQAVKSMQQMAVRYAKIIGATPTVSDGQLIALGLLPRTKRSRRSVPSSAPGVRVLAVRGRVVTIRVYEKGAASSRTKPFGACGSQVFSYLGDEAPAEQNAYQFEKYASRTTTELTFADTVPNGATVWLSARWLSARGETSPASSPLNVTITGGPALPKLGVIAG